MVTKWRLDCDVSSHTPPEAKALKPSWMCRPLLTRINTYVYTHDKGSPWQPCPMASACGQHMLGPLWRVQARPSPSEAYSELRPLTHPTAMLSHIHAGRLQWTISPHHEFRPCQSRGSKFQNVPGCSPARVHKKLMSDPANRHGARDMDVDAVDSTASVCWHAVLSSCSVT